MEPIYDKNNHDIEYVDIIVKDQNNNEIKVIAEYEDQTYSFTFDKYVILDAGEDVTEYNVEVVKRDKIQRTFNEN